MKNINEYINSSIVDEVIDEALVEEKSNDLFDLLSKHETIDEGVLGSIVGGLTGLIAGSSIMKAVCKALGIQSGPLYNLLTSKLVCTAAGAAIGKGM